MKADPQRIKIETKSGRKKMSYNFMNYDNEENAFARHFPKNSTKLFE